MLDDPGNQTLVDPAVLIEQPNIVRTYPPELNQFLFLQTRPRKISTHIEEEIEFPVPSDAWLAQIAAYIKSDLPIRDDQQFADAG